MNEPANILIAARLTWPRAWWPAIGYFIPEAKKSPVPRVTVEVGVLPGATGWATPQAVVLTFSPEDTDYRRVAATLLHELVHVALLRHRPKAGVHGLLFKQTLAAVAERLWGIKVSPSNGIYGTDARIERELGLGEVV